VRDRLPVTIAVAAAPALAATSLTPLFTGFAWWYVPAAVAACVAAITGTLTRALRPPPVARYAIAAGVFVVLLTVLCAHAGAFLGVVPTPRSLSSLASLVGDGKRDVSRLVPPVPRRPGLLLLVVASVYLVTATVDLLASLGRPTLAGLPLFALFAVPAAVARTGVGVVPFLLSAAGYLGLLLMERRTVLAAWGPRVGGSGGGRTRIPVGAAGARIGLVALAGAAVLPAALPAHDGGLLTAIGLGPGSGQHAPTTAVVDQPIVWLTAQLHDSRVIPLMRVSTVSPTYLRLTALEQFDGARFTLGKLTASRDDRISHALPVTAGDTPTVTINASISVSRAYVGHYLPLFGDPGKVTGLRGDWRLSRQTGTVFSAPDTIGGEHFDETVTVPSPSRAELAAQPLTVPANLRIDTALPGGMDPRVDALAHHLTANAHTLYDKVLALQQYLLSPAFTYDLAGAPTTTDGALSTFLFDTRRGYCQQFASAMTILARSLGIPARVAVGFIPGTPGGDGSYVVTNQDAHAWTEVWFRDSGWTTFDATPRDDAAGNRPPYARTATPSRPATAAPSTPASPARTAPRPPAATVPSGPAKAAGPAPRLPSGGRHDAGAGDWSGVLLDAVAVLALVLLGATPAIVRARRRARRLWPVGRAGTSRARGGRARASQAGTGRAGAVAPAGTQIRWTAHQSWEELIDVATDLGFQLADADSPRAAAVRLATDACEAGAARRCGPAGAAGRNTGMEPLRRLAAAEETARYAPADLLVSVDSRRGLARDVRAVTRELRACVPLTRQIRAAVLPSSVLRSVNLRATARSVWTAAAAWTVRIRRVLPTDDASAPPAVR
jgi:transglutaminase-like putative cysteine protease